MQTTVQESGLEPIFEGHQILYHTTQVRVMRTRNCVQKPTWFCMQFRVRPETAYKNQLGFVCSFGSSLHTKYAPPKPQLGETGRPPASTKTLGVPQLLNAFPSMGRFMELSLNTTGT
jgi:hypothetical protein